MNVRNWGGSLEGHWSFLWRHSVLFWSQGRSITSSNWMVGMKISSICGHALYLTIFRVRSFPDVSIDLGIIWHDITYFECQGTGSRDHDTCSSPLVRDRNEAYTITGGWTNNHFAGLANTRISGIRSNSRPNSPLIFKGALIKSWKYLEGLILGFAICGQRLFNFIFLRMVWNLNHTLLGMSTLLGINIWPQAGKKIPRLIHRIIGWMDGWFHLPRPLAELDPGLRYKCDNINHHERIQLFIVAAAHLPAAQRSVCLTYLQSILGQIIGNPTHNIECRWVEDNGVPPSPPRDWTGTLVPPLGTPVGS